MSLFDCFLNLIGRKKVHLTKKEDLSTQEKLEKEKLEAALQSNNRMTYGDETWVIYPGEQGFYGDEENPGLNRISLFFETEETDRSCYLTFDLFVSPDHKKVIPGNYRQYDVPREMCMQGEVSFHEKGEGIEEDEDDDDIKIIDGRLQIKQTEDKYIITADCLCENKEKLTLYYEGSLTYHNYVPEKNGQGHFLYEGKEYPLFVGLEEYEGVISEYYIPPLEEKYKFSHLKDSWTDMISIDLTLKDNATDWNHYLTFQIFQKEGDKVQSGEYVSPEDFTNTLPDTFRGYLGIPNEEDDKDIFLQITTGSIKITRDESFTIEGNCELENGKSLTFIYTGVPEWYNES